MSEPRTCPGCGSPLDEGSPPGCCPNCPSGATIASDEPFLSATEFEGMGLDPVEDLDSGVAPNPDSPTVSLLPNGPPVERPSTRPDTKTMGPEPRGEWPSAGAPVRYFGDYHLIREIARGGMGVVYLARQVSLNRQVALKMILASRLANEAAVRRFEAEAEASANLDHPGIVPIYEIGEHDEQHYFSMKWIDGPNLAHEIPRLKGEPRDSAALLASVARAVHHAHERGILHRDLKPANILIDRHGRPYVTDFGLAKKISGDSDLTKSGAIVGSPAYMPPEQASGRRGVVTTASDVYSLGAVLYETLTGHPPFSAGSAVETLVLVLEGEPARPRAVNPLACADLETICLKCLEKDPKRRYPSALELAEDLERYGRGEPIAARPASAWDRASKWVRRRPAIAAMGLAILILAAAGISGVALQWRRAVLASRAALAAKDLADEARQQAQRELERAERNQYFNRIALAERYWTASKVERAEQYLDACPAPLRRWEWDYLKRLCHPEFRRFPGEGAAFFPDGRTLAIDDRARGTLSLVDASTGAVIRALPSLGSHVLCFAISPDGRRLAAAAHDRTVKVWDVADGREVATLGPHAGDWVMRLSFSPDGTRLATAGARKNFREGGAMAEQIRIWALPSGGLVRAIPDAGRSVAYSPDGRRLVICSETAGPRDPAKGAEGNPVGIASGSLKLLDAEDGRELWSVPRGGFSETDSVFSLDGAMIASSFGRTGEVRLRDAATGKLLRTLRGHNDASTALAFSPDGKRLAGGGVDSSVIVWNLDGDDSVIYRGHRGTVETVGFSPDGRSLVTAGSDRTVRIWDATRAQGFRVLPGSEPPGFVAEPSPDGSRIAVVRRRGVDTILSQVDAESGREISPIRAIPSFRGAYFHILLRYSPDGRWIASTDGKAAVEACDAATGKVRTTFAGPEDRASALAFSPDGERVAAGHGGQVRIWDRSDGRELVSISCLLTPLALAFSPDGSKLVTVGDGRRDGTLRKDAVRCGRVWEASTGKHLFDLPIDDVPSGAIVFTADGSKMATTGADRIARLFDASDGRELFQLRGHSGSVYDVAFSPDGSRLISGSTDPSIKLWDVASGQEILELETDFNVRRLGFTSDGLRILAGGDGKVRAWEATRPDKGEAGRGSSPRK